MRTIQGKKALVTGAAAGIGRALALGLAREGAAVYLLDRNEAGLAAVAHEVRSRGCEARTAICDVSRGEQISGAVETLLHRWGELDILVNNVGVAYYGPTLTMPAEQWERLLAINLHAPIQFTRELLPTLATRPEAHIVNVSSICGLISGGRFLAYHVTKFGLVGFSEGLRLEFARQGVGVTTLCPGPVLTDLYASAPCGHVGRQTPTPPRWLSTTPERCAAKAIRAIYHNRGLVLVTPLAYLLYYLRRFAPGLLDLVARFEYRKARKKKAALDEPRILPFPTRDLPDVAPIRRAA